jgi:hypothetical protein
MRAKSTKSKYTAEVIAPCEQRWMAHTIAGNDRATASPISATVVCRRNRPLLHFVRDANERALAFVYCEDESRVAVPRQTAHAR